MKKNKATRELVNIFPAYTKMRSNEQSVGYLLLNSFASPMDYMTESLNTMQKNIYLSTRNLDEIDILHRVSLPTTFDFTYETDDPLNPQVVAPTVSGYANGTWYLVTPSDLNTIRDFWYEAIPTRVSLSEIVSGIDYELISEVAEDFPVSGEFLHHLGGGRLHIETTGGIQYLTSDSQSIYRGHVTLHGQTRKGTIETETIIFPWDMKQPTQKEWKEINQVDVHNMEDGVTVDIRSADFTSGPYLSHYNLAYSDNRNKVDEFWDLGVQDSMPTLDYIGYISDEWQQLVLGFSNKEVKKSWELVDENYNNVSGIDIAVQPFTNHAWVIDDSNMLYLYDIYDTVVSGVSNLRGITNGSHIQIDVDTPSVVLGQDISILPWHARPLKEIQKYRIWYQTPSGTKYGLLGGVPVAYTSDFYVRGEQTLTRTIENTITLTATERGEYLFVMEAEFVDYDIHTTKVIVPVNFKTPLAQFDLSLLIPTTVDGIEFDADQQIWIKSANDIYQIKLHFDNMLIDYNNKVLYFREEYDYVDVET